MHTAAWANSTIGQSIVYGVHTWLALSLGLLRLLTFTTQIVLLVYKPSRP